MERSARNFPSSAISTEQLGIKLFNFRGALSAKRSAKIENRRART